VLEVKQALEAIGGSSIDSAICEHLIAQEGQTLSCPGSKADAIYLIKSGRVEVFEGVDSDEQPSERKIMGPGDFVGEMGFELNTVARMTIRALERTHLLRIDGRSLELRLRRNCEGRPFQLKRLLGLGERLIFVS